MTVGKSGRAELAQIMKQSQGRLWADFESAQAFTHRGNRGASREDALIQFLSGALPTRFSARRGEVVDLGGRRSGQVDIILFDSMRNAPFARSTDENVVIAVEAVIAVIEVKTTITREETRKTIGGIQKIQDMRPWGQPWARNRPRGKPADQGPRYFSTLFAYSSDHATADWARKELDRVREVADEVGTPVDHLDRVVVLDQGMLLPADGRAMSSGDNQDVLGVWFQSLVNFLTREVERRHPMPWSEYGKWTGPTWSDVLPEQFSAVGPKRFSRTQVGKYISGN